MDTRTYRVFISYRHADNREEGRQWATWLHQAIETYEIPRDLVGTKNSRGEPIPERIFPVFRDEGELAANASLSSAIPTAAATDRRSSPGPRTRLIPGGTGSSWGCSEWVSAITRCRATVDIA